MLPSYFDYNFVHLRKKTRVRPELSPKFLSPLGSNPAYTRPEKPGLIYNSVALTAFKTLSYDHVIKSDQISKRWTDFYI